MQFSSVAIEQAVGHILGHNVVDQTGRRVLRKGRQVTAADVALLADLGRTHVYCAQLTDNDIDENTAAVQIVAAVIGDGLLCSQAKTGRVNVSAEQRCLLRIDTAKLKQLNRNNGITLATHLTNSPAQAGQMVATLKIIPYAVPREAVEAAVALGTLMVGQPLTTQRVSLILSGAQAAQARIVRGYETALRPRLAWLGSELAHTEFIALGFGDQDERVGVTQLAEAIKRHKTAGFDMIMLAGDTAIMDRHDIAPSAVEMAGGKVVCYGAPVDPGNLLMIGQLGETPIVGAPSCARSPKPNIIDLVLPRLLAGDLLTEDDILDLAHGGLLEDVPERPLPRQRAVAHEA